MGREMEVDLGGVGGGEVNALYGILKALVEIPKNKKELRRSIGRRSVWCRGTRLLVEQLDLIPDMDSLLSEAVVV